MSRGQMMFVFLSLPALMVGVDGLLKGELLRSLAGWAVFGMLVWVGIDVWPRAVAIWKARYAEEIERATSATGKSWPMILVGVVFALVCFVGAGWILVAPYEELIAWDRSTAWILRGLESAAGEWLGRVVFAVLFALAGLLSSYGAWMRLRA